MSSGGKTWNADQSLAAFMRMVRKMPDGCWEWTGSDNGAGYGQVTRGKKRYYTHRWLYEVLVGPIPDGLQLDHLCRNPPCCNPAHLEPVTALINNHRGKTNFRKTHCPQGHPYDEANTRFYDGRRICITCNIERSAAWHEAHRPLRSAAA